MTGHSRVAVVQAAPVAFDVAATTEKAAALVARAAAEGAGLIVLPEVFVSGYPKGLDFGVRVGTRSAAGRVAFERYAAGAIEVPGPTTARLGALAREHGVHLVMGVTERAGGTLYCTVLFFGADGELLGRHRKLVPTAFERVIWGRGDGSTLTVVGTPHGRVGAAICWENYMPLYRTALYAKGVQLYCAPTVDDRESWIPTVRHIAVEGRCFVLSACQFARRDDYPDDYPGDDSGAVLIRGGSCIVDPFGEVLAGPVYDRETILCADVDLGAIVRGKYDLDVTGHYARPDVFSLRVDETQRGVEFAAGDPSGPTDPESE